MNSLPKEEARRIIKRHQEKSSAIWLWVLLTIILIALGWFGLMKLADFTQAHYIKKNRLFTWDWNWPLSIKEKEEAKVVEKYIEPARPEEIDTPIKKYACDKWGQYECLVMISVFEAESGWDNTAWGVNVDTNSPKGYTLDYGIAQINTINWKLEGCTLADITDPVLNIDCAYKIWDRADGN